MSWLPNASIHQGHATRKFVMDCLRVKKDIRFDALMVMFMTDTQYTLSDKFLTNYHDGLIDAFTARKIINWAKNRADEDRMCRLKQEWEQEALKKMIVSLHKYNNSAKDNARQLRALGIFAA